MKCVSFIKDSLLPVLGGTVGRDESTEKEWIK